MQKRPQTTRTAFTASLALAFVALLSCTISAESTAQVINPWTAELIATIDTEADAGDLVITFQLVNVSTGRVVHQIDATAITVVDVGNQIDCSYSLDWSQVWTANSSYAWNIVIDATNAGDSVVLSDWTQIVDTANHQGTYSATPSTRNIQGGVETTRLSGAVADYLL